MNRICILLMAMVVMVGAPFFFAAHEALAEVLTGTAGEDTLLGTDGEDYLRGGLPQGSRRGRLPRR